MESDAGNKSRMGAGTTEAGVDKVRSGVISFHWLITKKLTLFPALAGAAPHQKSSFT